MRIDNKDKEKLEIEKKLKDNKTKEYTFDFEGRLVHINPLKQNKMN